MRLIRTFQVLILALALIASGATPRAHVAAPNADAASAHEMHDVIRYADLAIAPGQDCDHATPAHHSPDHGLCDNCCAACVSASLIAAAPAQVALGVPRSELVPVAVARLVGRIIPAEPGVPKLPLT